MIIRRSAGIAAFVLVAACDPSECDRASDVCATPDPVVVSLFGTTETDACAETAAGSNETACTECREVCSAPRDTNADEVLGCWATAVAGSSRRVLCLGADFVPREVREAGHGEHSFQLWRGEPGSETRDLSGAYEVADGVIRLRLDEMPGEQLCASVRLAPRNGVATGDLDRTCEGDDALLLAWTTADEPR